MSWTRGYLHRGVSKVLCSAEVAPGVQIDVILLAVMNFCSHSVFNIYLLTLFWPSFSRFGYRGAADRKKLS
ncbi:hypothetical protein BDV12DRAFT_166968 [Aspergillus spectabilis]